MGANFVAILENPADRTEEAINQALSLGRSRDGWTRFSHEGRSYACWWAAPRYFERDEEPERWEALRKYLVRAREFLGGGAVYLGNDLVTPRTPEDVAGEWPFFLPPRVSDEWLAEPDVASHPELANVQERAGLPW